MHTSIKKSVFGTLLLTGLLSAHSQAATVLGIQAGYTNWNPDFSGDFQSEAASSTNIDLEDDLGLDSDSNNIFYFALEHPIPVLPNIKIVNTELKTSASAKLGTTVIFDGQTFNTGVDVKSDIDLSHNDVTLYYEILDNWVSLDVGVTARVFDGEIKIASDTLSAKQSLNVTIPLLYGKAQFDLPLTGLSVGANMNYLSVSGNTLSDLDLFLNYKFVFGLGLTAGVRSFNIELDNESDLSSDIEMRGAYFGASFVF